MDFLGGGFKYCLLSPLFGDDSQFWLKFFKWVETTNSFLDVNAFRTSGFTEVIDLWQLLCFYRDLFKREFVEDVWTLFEHGIYDRYCLFVHGLWLVHWSCLCLVYWFTGYIDREREREIVYVHPKICALSTHSEHLHLCWDVFLLAKKNVNFVFIGAVIISPRLLGLYKGWKTTQFQKGNTLLGTSISPAKAILKMIFLFPRWDMYIKPL